MTIDQNCFIEKHANCENSQAREKNECRSSEDYNEINECISDADREFERCKKKAEDECEAKKPDNQNNNASSASNASTSSSTTSLISSTQQPTSLQETPSPPPPPPSSTNLPFSSPLPSLPQTSPTPASRGLGTDTKIIIGIGSAVGLLLCLCGIGAIYYYKYKRNANKTSTTLEEDNNTNSTDNQASLETNEKANSDASPRSPNLHQGGQDIRDDKSCLTETNETPKTPGLTDRKQPSTVLTTSTSSQQDDKTNSTDYQASLEKKEEANSDAIPRSPNLQQGAPDTSDDESCITENNSTGIQYSLRGNQPPTQTPPGLIRFGDGTTYSLDHIEQAREVLEDFATSAKKGSAEVEKPSSYDDKESHTKTKEDRMGAARAESSSTKESALEECKETSTIQDSETKASPPLMTPQHKESIPTSPHRQALSFWEERTRGETGRANIIQQLTPLSRRRSPSTHQLN